MVSSGLVERVDVSHFRLSIHLLIAFLILSLIFWNYLELKELTISKISLNKFIPIIFLILIFTQISIGAFVSGMDAGKIYNSWPLMGSSYFPNDSELINLFSFRSFSDPSLVQFMHRNIAYFIMGFYILILIEIYKKKMTVFFKIIKIIGFLLLVQVILGILTLLSGAQIFLASMHQISSIFLVSSAIYFLYLNSNTS
jgi:cytochrome c oxidase assembly protein subunit 15